jgi:hypothetical protein
MDSGVLMSLSPLGLQLQCPLLTGIRHDARAFKADDSAALSVAGFFASFETPTGAYQPSAQI